MYGHFPPNHQDDLYTQIAAESYENTVIIHRDALPAHLQVESCVSSELRRLRLSKERTRRETYRRVSSKVQGDLNVVKTTDCNWQFLVSKFRLVLKMPHEVFSPRSAYGSPFGPLHNSPCM